MLFRSLPFAVFFFAFQVAPLLWVAINSLIVGDSWSLANFSKIFSSKFYLQAIKHSLQIAFWSSLFGIVIAILGSYSLRQVDSKLRDFVMAFSNMTSNFAGVPLAFAFIILLGFNGALTLLLKQAGWIANSQGVLEKNGVQARIPLLYFSDDTTRQGLALAVADMVKPLGIVLEVSGKTREEVKRLKHSSTVLYGWGAHSPQEVYNLYSGSKAGKGSYNAGYYNNPTVNAHLDAAERAPTLAASYPHWKNAMWDGQTGLGMLGDAPWAWLVTALAIAGLARRYRRAG